MNWIRYFDSYEKVKKRVMEMIIGRLESEVESLEEDEEIEGEEIVENLNSVICYLRGKYKIYGDVKSK